MGLFDLVTNTVEGITETTINTAKLVVSPVVAPFDNGKAIDDSIQGIENGIEKIGKSEKD